MKFHELVEEYRVASGMTRERFAEHCGLGREVFSRYERGQLQGPRLKTALRVMRAVGIPFERLGEVNFESEDHHREPLRILLRAKVNKEDSAAGDRSDARLLWSGQNQASLDGCHGRADNCSQKLSKED